MRKTNMSVSLSRLTKPRHESRFWRAASAAWTRHRHRRFCWIWRLVELRAGSFPRGAARPYCPYIFRSGGLNTCKSAMFERLGWEPRRRRWIIGQGKVGFFVLHHLWKTQEETKASSGSFGKCKTHAKYDTEYSMSFLLFP